MAPAPEFIGLMVFFVIVVSLVMWVVYWRQNSWGA
jgi:hypothetical protein